jgi:Aspartyl protease/PDZ domain
MRPPRLSPILVGCSFLIGFLGASIRAFGADDSLTPGVLEEFVVGKEGRPLLLPVEVGGQLYRFEVDTGANCSVYDQRLRRHLGAPIRQSTVDTPGGFLRTELFESPEAHLGRITWHSKSPIVCINMSQLRQSMGDHLDGLLGMDFLRNHVVQIDFDTGHLRFLSAGGMNPDGWGERIPLTFGLHLCPTVRTTLGGSVETDCRIDTGANPSCLDIFTFNSLQENRKLRLFATPHRVLTAVGTVSRESGLVETISIGSESHQWMRVDAATTSLIGLQFLSRYTITLDFPDKVMYLKPGRHYADAYCLATSGLDVLQINGQFVIQSVDPQGPASKLGIAPEDVIVRINEQNANDYDLFALGRLLTSQVGSKVSLTIRRKKKEFDVTLILAERALQATQ